MQGLVLLLTFFRDINGWSDAAYLGTSVACNVKGTALFLRPYDASEGTVGPVLGG